MNNELTQNGNATDVLAVAEAMAHVNMARPWNASTQLWWNDPAVNTVLHDGVRAGYLCRMSTTQVQWTEAGVEACRAAKEASRAAAREALADGEFALYDLGEGVQVIEQSNWETGCDSRYSKTVHVRRKGSEPESPLCKLKFHVFFNWDGSARYVHAVDAESGDSIGNWRSKHMPLTYVQASAIKLLVGERMGLAPALVDDARKYLEGGAVDLINSAAIEKEAVSLDNRLRTDPTLNEQVNTLADDLKAQYGFAPRKPVTVCE